MALTDDTIIGCLRSCSIHDAAGEEEIWPLAFGKICLMTQWTYFKIIVSYYFFVKQ
jgi:hypothetical protein